MVLTNEDAYHQQAAARRRDLPILHSSVGPDLFKCVRRSFTFEKLRFGNGHANLLLASEICGKALRLRAGGDVEQWDKITQLHQEIDGQAFRRFLKNRVLLSNDAPNFCVS